MKTFQPAFNHCQCTYLNDSGWYHCEMKYGHVGDHGSMIYWSSEECTNEQHFADFDSDSLTRPHLPDK